MSDETQVLTLRRDNENIAWGFRLDGGVDVGRPISVLRVLRNGAAETAGLEIGDRILSINDINAAYLTQSQANELMKASSQDILLRIIRSDNSFEISTPFEAKNQLPESQQYRPNKPHQSGPVNHFSPHNPIASITPSNTSNFNNDPKRNHINGPSKPLSNGRANSSNRAPIRPLYSPVNQPNGNRGRDFVPSNSNHQSPRQTLPTHEKYSSNEVSPAVSDAANQPNFHVNNQINGAPNKGPRAHNGYPVENGRVPNVVSNLSSNPDPKRRPWTYAPDKNVIEEHSRRIRRNLVRMNSGPQNRSEFTKNYNRRNVSTTDQRKKYEEEEKEEYKPFNEQAYLAGRIPLVKGGPIDPSVFTEVPVIKNEPEDNLEENYRQPFDERAYLEGRVPILGDPIAEKLPKREKRECKDMAPSWTRERCQLSEDEYDENAFLGGRIAVLNSPLQRQTSYRRNSNTVVTEIEICEEDDSLLEDKRNAFDEKAYLEGNIPILGDPVAQYLPKREKREWADAAPSWTRERCVLSEDEFDENAFLDGRISVLKSSNERMSRLKVGADYGKRRQQSQPAPISWQNWRGRSTSRDRGAISENEYDDERYIKNRRGSQKQYVTDTEDCATTEMNLGYYNYSSNEEVSDEEKTFNTLIYSGKKIPSKAFSRLERSFSKENNVPENVEETGESGFDLDSAMARLGTTTDDPNQYLQMLKNSIEESTHNLQAESTEF